MERALQMGARTYSDHDVSLEARMETLQMGACTGKGSFGNSGTRHQQVWAWPSMPSHLGNCAVLDMLLHLCGDSNVRNVA